MYDQTNLKYIHIITYILGGITDIGGGYILYRIFWIGNKVLITGKILSTYLASYFGYEYRYL